MKKGEKAMKIEQIPPGLIPIDISVTCEIDDCMQEAEYFYSNLTTSPDDAYTWSLCTIHAAEYEERGDVQ